MNLTDNEILKFQMGCPIFLDDICAIYPVKLSEIVEHGFDDFSKYLNIITSTKPVMETDNELTQLMKQLTDFQYILMIATLDPEVNELLRKAFRFFTHEDAVFILDPAQIILGPVEEKHILNEEKFYEFQKIIRRMYFIETECDDIIIYDDDAPQVRALKEKMRRDMARVRKAKAKKANQEGTDLKFSDLIGSMTLNNCGLNMINIWDLTYYAFHDQLKRMGWRDQFNINQKAALAGAKIDKSQLKHWMRSIASSDN